MRELGNERHCPYLRSWAISFTPPSHWGLRAFIKVPLPGFPCHREKEIKYLLNGTAKFGGTQGLLRNTDHCFTFSFFSFFILIFAVSFPLYVFLSLSIKSVLRFLTIYFCNSLSSVYSFLELLFLLDFVSIGIQKEYGGRRITKDRK